MIETQKTIDEWAVKTFGPMKNECRAIERMLQEVEELKELYSNNDIGDMNKVANECADILITLYQVATTIGFDLHESVDHKMQINRNRKWKRAEDGTGRHID